MWAAAQTIFFGVLVTFSIDSHHSSHKKTKSFFGMSTPHYIGVLRKEAVPYNFYGRLYIEDRRFFLCTKKSVKDFFGTSAPRHLCVLRKDIVRYSSKTNSKQVYDAIADEVFGFREKKEKSETGSHNRAETTTRSKNYKISSSAKKPA